MAMRRNPPARYCSCEARLARDNQDTRCGPCRGGSHVRRPSKRSWAVFPLGAGSVVDPVPQQLLDVFGCCLRVRTTEVLAHHADP